MQLSTKYAQLNAEVTLPYLEQGDPEGRPVILLHGVTDSHRSFDLVREHLPRSIRALALTQRGHGDASRPQAGYQPSDLADDLLAFMDRLGLESAVIVGHSMGSFAAQRFAIDHPERVSKLILIGSFATCRDNQGVVEFVAENISRLRDPISPEFATGFQQSTVAKDVDADFFAMAVAESLKVPANVWKEACESMIVNDHTDELGKITAPTLLIWGDRDGYFDRAEQEKLLEGIEGAELKVYPGDGHAPHWESPQKVAADITKFAQQPVSKRKTATAVI